MASTNDLVMLEGGPLIAPDALPGTLGWTLKPEGLCKDDTCVIVSDRSALYSNDLLDVTAVAAHLDRPTVHDAESGLVAVGAPRDQRRGALHDLQAPDFTLPDLDGTAHSLSDHCSKKKLLVAFSSW